MRSLFTLLLFIGLVRISYERIDPQHSNSSSHKGREVLYLPNGQALEVISLGYRHFLADVLWFNTVSYFGKHYKSDRDYAWLYHMCDLVTSLDPKARHVYQFASNMLSWEAKLPDKSVLILDKAVSNFPDDWFFYYLRGFNYMYFLKDFVAAKADFVMAARKPGAPVVAARLAAKLAIDQDNPDFVKQFLRDMINSTPDENARRALFQRLREIEEKKDLKLPEKLLNHQN